MHHGKIPHAHLAGDLIITAATQRTFKTSGLSVCSFTEQTKDPRGFVYTVRLTRNISAPNDENYSLYNIGVQGRLRSIFITRVLKGKNVYFRRPKKGQSNNAGDIKYQKRRGAYAEGGNQPAPNNHRTRRVADISGKLIEERIWFISFDGEICEFQVVVPFTVENKFKGFPLGHEWAPPPPEPGGENEEDPEPDDQPEDDGE